MRLGCYGVYCLVANQYCAIVCKILCYRCNDGKADLTQVFELSELGRGQAFLHLRQVHERAYDEFLHKLPAVQSGALLNMRETAGDLSMRAVASSSSAPHSHAHPHHRAPATRPHTSDSASSDDHALQNPHTEPGTEPHECTAGGNGGAEGDTVAELVDASLTTKVPGAAQLQQSINNNSSAHMRDENAARNMQQRLAEANRSRLRRLKASSAERHLEAVRSKKRRETLTPVQRQADYDRRKRKKKRQEESVRSRKRREQASEESRQKEQLRSRERRRNATEDQRKREAERSKRRRENASEEQRIKERERCRKRYETKKSRKGGGSQYSSNNSSGNMSDDDDNGSHSSMSVSDYDHYSHRQQRHYDDNSTRQQQHQRHEYYHQEELNQHQQLQHNYDLSRPLNDAIVRQPDQQQQQSRFPSALPPATATGQAFQVPPLDAIRVPLPPPSAASGLGSPSRDDMRSSLSDTSGFRFFSAPSPSTSSFPTQAPGASFASITGTARPPPRPAAPTINHTASPFRSGRLLPMYPQHLATSPIARSTTGGGTNRPLDPASGNSSSNNFSVAAPSQQPQFALPHLPSSLHVLSQSLQPLPSSSSATNRDQQARVAMASRVNAGTNAPGAATGSQMVGPSSHVNAADNAERAPTQETTSNNNNLAFV